MDAVRIVFDVFVDKADGIDSPFEEGDLPGDPLFSSVNMVVVCQKSDQKLAQFLQNLPKFFDEAKQESPADGFKIRVELGTVLNGRFFVDDLLELKEYDPKNP